MNTGNLPKSDSHPKDQVINLVDFDDQAVEIENVINIRSVNNTEGPTINVDGTGITNSTDVQHLLDESSFSSGIPVDRNVPLGVALNTGNQPESDTQQYPFCGKYYKSINKHIVGAHPEEYRQRLVGKHVPSQPNIGVSTSKEDDLKIIERDLQKFNLQEWHTMNEDDLNKYVDEFQMYLKNVIHILPGPKHPAIKYYELRKKNKHVSSQNSNYSKNSNPERSTKRDRNKRKEAYIYQTIQFDYYNRRKKAVRRVFNDVTRACPINL